MLEAALVGLGVAIAPSYLVEEDLRTGRLIAPWGFIETPARLGLWLPASAPRRDIEQLAEWLKDEIGQSSG
jgi:DNA-binding transcriptional LysR family regulator